MVVDGKGAKTKRGVLIAASPSGLKLEGIGYPNNSCALAIDALQSAMKLQDGDEDHKDSFYVQAVAQKGSARQS